MAGYPLIKDYLVPYSLNAPKTAALRTELDRMCDGLASEVVWDFANTAELNALSYSLDKCDCALSEVRSPFDSTIAESLTTHPCVVIFLFTLQNTNVGVALAIDIKDIVDAHNKHFLIPYFERRILGVERALIQISRGQITT